MREIKFRAWDGELKEMIGPEEVLSCSFIGLDGEWLGLSDLLKGEGGFELMQYTGLKDKNGVEIYEGDIVEAFSHGVKGTFEVKWRQEGSPSWILFPAWQSSQMWYLHAVETEKGYYKDNVTVVGNIYENPELLKEDQE